MSKLITQQALVLIILVISGCAGTKGKKSVGEDPVAPTAGAPVAHEASGESAKIDGERRLLIVSVTNNSLSSKAIDRVKASDFASQEGMATTTDLNALLALMSAYRLAGRSVDEVLVIARRMSDVVTSKGVDKDLPEAAQLELGLTGVQTGRLAFAEFWFDKLYKSKNASIRASIINAKGVMAVRMERIPEAVALFKEALSVTPDFKPALLNIGFLALQGGDVATAQKSLGGLDGDWYAEAGLISVLRLQGEADKAEASCEKILREHPKHKQTLINCGINAWQGKKDFAKARDLIGKALVIPGGSLVWDEKAGRILGVLDGEEDRARQAKSLKEAADRKLEKEKAAPKLPAGQPSEAAPPKAAP